MKRREQIAGVAISFSLALILSPAGHAADYPTKAIQIVSAVPIGSATDILARQVGEKLGRRVEPLLLVVSQVEAGSDRIVNIAF